MARKPVPLADIHNEELIILAEISYMYDRPAPDPFEWPTLYFASKTFITNPNETPPNVLYDGRITKDFSYSVSMFSNDKATGIVRPNNGSIVIANDDGKYDFLTEKAFDGCPVKIKVGYPSLNYNEFITVFWGTQFNPQFSLNNIEFRLRDNLERFNTQLLTKKYLGDYYVLEGGFSGLKDKKKPVVYGTVLSANLNCVDTARYIYHTGVLMQGASIYNAYVRVYDVFDRGNKLVRGADYTSVIDMMTNPPAASNYRVWSGLYNGSFSTYIRLGSKPIGQTSVRMRILNDYGPVDRFEQILRDTSVAAVYYDNFADNAFDNIPDSILWDLTFGGYLDSDTTGSDLISKILSSVRAWLSIDANGKFICGLLDDPSETDYLFEINETNSKLISIDSVNDNIIYDYTLRHSKNDTVQVDLSSNVTPELESFLAEEYRVINKNSTFVKDRHHLANEYEQDSVLTTIDYGAYQSEIDALNAEAERQFNILSKDRTQITVNFVKMTFDMMDKINIGQDVLVKLNRLGLEDGKTFKIVSYEPNFLRGNAILKLWR